MARITEIQYVCMDVSFNSIDLSKRGVQKRLLRMIWGFAGFHLTLTLTLILIDDYIPPAYIPPELEQ